MDRIVFLDRDGTINEEVHYLYKPEDMFFLPGVPEALKRLLEAGFRIVVVTNQAGVARGYYTEDDVKKLHEYMNQQLMAQGVHIDHFFYCPHHPEEGIVPYKRECRCRKPETGLLEAAEKYYEIDKSHSYMIGDKSADIEAGRRYGVRTVLVGTGYGADIHQKQLESGKPWPYDHYADTLLYGADWIIEQETDKQDKRGKD